MELTYNLKIDCTELAGYGEYWFWESHPNQDTVKKFLEIVVNPTYNESKIF